MAYWIICKKEFLMEDVGDGSREVALMPGKHYIVDYTAPNKKWCFTVISELGPHHWFTKKGIKKYFLNPEVFFPSIFSDEEDIL